MQSVTKTITVIIGVATARKEFPALETPVLTYSMRPRSGILTTASSG